MSKTTPSSESQPDRTPDRPQGLPAEALTPLAATAMMRALGLTKNTAYVWLKQGCPRVSVPGKGGKDEARFVPYDLVDWAVRSGRSVPSLPAWYAAGEALPFDGGPIDRAGVDPSSPESVLISLRRAASLVDAVARRVDASGHTGELVKQTTALKKISEEVRHLIELYARVTERSGRVMPVDDARRLLGELAALLLGEVDGLAKRDTEALVDGMARAGLLRDGMDPEAARRVAAQCLMASGRRVRDRLASGVRRLGERMEGAA